MKKYIVLLLLVGLFSRTKAATPDFLDFLNEARSVRARGLASIELFDDDVLTSPAKLSPVSGLSVETYYAMRSWGVGLFNLGALYVRPQYCLGAGLLNLNAGSEDFYITHFEGAEPERYRRQLENDTLLRLIAGYNFKQPEISVGAGINYISSVLFEDYKYNNFTYDLGMEAKVLTPVKVSFLAKNFTGVSGNYSSNGILVSTNVFSLPSDIEFGASFNYRALDTYLAGCYSLAQKNTGISLGLEYSLNYTQIYPLQKAQIRLGWQYNPQSVIDISNFSLGFGIGYQRMSLDYAFVPHPYLGASHYLSVGYRFGGPSEQASFSGRLLDRFLLIYSSATKTFDEIGFNRLEDWVKVINENKFYRIKIVGTPEINEAVESFLINAENVSESKISFEVKYQPPLDTGEILIYGP